MTVVLTVSKTLNGVAAADTLEGGGSGVALGQTPTGAYAPLIDKDANTGHQNIYVRHDAVMDPVTGFQVHIQQYGTGTGYAYGGGDTAANDFASMANMGHASGNSKNNADGMSGGLWMEMEADVGVSNRFDQAGRPSLVKIFGDNGGTGGDATSLDNAFLVAAEAMVYDNGGTETNGSAPVAGEIGKSGDTVRGDNAHLQFRLFIPSAHPSSGLIQWETVFGYAFTA